MRPTRWTCVAIVVLEACGGGDSSSDASGAAGAASGGTSVGSDSGGRRAVNDSGAGAIGGEATSGAGAIGGEASGGAGERSKCKRGVAYGHHSKADLDALSPAVSWWYNWAFAPDEALRDGSYRALDVEYVPMIWGEGSDRAAAMTDIPEGARALLGFNEPNFGSQADLSASEAARLWPELEALADARNLTLVSPAVNFCGGDCQETDPFQYLDDFFAACRGCRVDAIAFHIYVGCHPDGENHAEWLINHVKTYEARFSKPLWLTEFACDDATREAEQIAFMQDAVEFLENDPRIVRYAWFSGRADNVPHVDLLGDDGKLTALGQRYVELEQTAGCRR
jgi:hypothetical protein